MGILQFWKSALQWAAKSTFAVWRWTPETAFMFALGVILGAVSHYWREGWSAMLGELNILIDYVLIPAVVGFVLLFIFNLFRAPAALYNGLSHRLDDLEKRLTPGLEFLISDDGGIESLPRGTSIITGGGQIESNTRGYDRVVRIHCINNNSIPVENVEAYLIDLFELRTVLIHRV